MMEQAIRLNEKKSKIKIKGTGNEYRSKFPNQPAQNLNPTNHRLSIEINNIMEKEIDRLTGNKVFGKRYAKEIILLRKQWRSFCTTYRKILRESDSFEGNHIADNHKKTVSKSDGKQMN